MKKKKVKPEEFDFESDIEIDPHNLPFEWTRQSSLVWKYSKEYANIVKDRETIKTQIESEQADLKKLKAEKALDVRENWDDYNLDKSPNNDTVNEMVEMNEEVQEAIENIKTLQEELNEFIWLSSRFSGIKNAFEHKKTSLEYLSRLYLAGYHAEPKIPSELSDGDEESVRSSIDKSLSQEMKKRRKKSEKENKKRRKK